MNTTAFTIVALATLFAVTFAAPAQDFNSTELPPAPVNWTLVAEKVADIELVLRTNIPEIEAIATSENATIGANIGQKLEEFSESALLILEQVNAAVQDQTLTYTVAQSHISTLKGNLARLMGSLAADLAGLTVPTQEAIDAVKKNTFDTIEAKDAELCAIFDDISCQASPSTEASTEGSTQGV